MDPETDQSKKKRKGGVEHERGGGKSGNKSVVSSKKTRFTIHIKIRGTKPGNSLHFKGERRGGGVTTLEPQNSITLASLNDDNSSQKGMNNNISPAGRMHEGITWNHDLNEQKFSAYQSKTVKYI